MELVRAYIQNKQRQFMQIPFFRWMRHGESADIALRLFHKLSFFVMSFQDMLRLNEARFQNPELQAIARHHREEDTNHEQWFLSDLLAIHGELPDVRALFAKESIATREAAYTLVSEIYRAEDDYARLAILFVLESTGHVFFRNVVDYLERYGCRLKLRYFAREHLGVELDHELFEDDVHTALDRIRLLPEQEKAILKLVDRGFEAIATMLDALVEGSLHTRTIGAVLPLPLTSETLAMAAAEGL
jgi:hypothetical protein